MKGHLTQRIIIASGLILALVSVANAQVAMPCGWYAEANVGGSSISNRPYSGSVNNGFAWNVNVGYKFMPYLAAEIGYSRYANLTVKSNGTTAGRDNHYSYDLAAKGIVPISDSGAEVFGKLGVARLNDRISVSNTAVANSIGLTAGNHNATGLYMDLGADYAFTPQVAGNIQWARAKGNSRTGTADLYSVGVTVMFE